mmetsp:Transcript_33275/g.56067  ORF Transcript_33275/g.56067 Transcript_33275/m.56067 type:complete len:112 (-) Transcript_33275:210-545(-)
MGERTKEREKRKDTPNNIKKGEEKQRNGVPNSPPLFVLFVMLCLCVFSLSLSSFLPLFLLHPLSFAFLLLLLLSSPSSFFSPFGPPFDLLSLATSSPPFLLFFFSSSSSRH